jgi:hypothetical protein
MPDFYKGLADEGMTPHEIVERFRKLFGRDMTPAERRSFFLDFPVQKEKESDNS